MRTTLILCTGACLALGLCVELLGLVDVLELRSYDIRARVRAAQSPLVSNRLVAISIDKTSEEALGPFPWPHGAYLSLVQTLGAVGARGVLFVLDFRPENLPSTPWPVESLPIYVVAPYTRVLRQPRREPPWVGEQAPVPADIAAGSPVASFSVLPASTLDGLYRHVQMLALYGPDRRTKHSLEYRFALDAASSESALDGLPLDKTGRLLLTSGRVAVPVVSFIDALNTNGAGADIADLLKGRWAIVGVGSPAHSQAIRTPFGMRSPLELRVALINSLLTRDFVAPRSTRTTLCLFVLWAVVLGGMCLWIGARLVPSWAIASVGIAVALAHVIIAAVVFQIGDVWLTVAAPVLSILVTTFAWILIVGSARLRAVEARAFQAEREAAFGVMSAQMRHEIRNLLNSIASPAAMIRRNFAEGDPLGLRDRPEEICAEMDVISSRVHDLSDMVDRELSFFQPESFVFAEADLWACAIAARDVLRADIEEAGVVVNLEVLENRNVAWLDPEKMRIVFVNLIRNAIQAMPDGGVLDISYDEPRGFLTNRKARVTVSDSGIGMDAAQLAHLFEPFYTTKARGLGLGLLNARQIVDAHDGRIAATCETGRGCSFTVTVPTVSQGTGSPRVANS